MSECKIHLEVARGKQGTGFGGCEGKTGNISF